MRWNGGATWLREAVDITDNFQQHRLGCWVELHSLSCALSQDAAQQQKWAQASSAGSAHGLLATQAALQPAWHAFSAHRDELLAAGQVGSSVQTCSFAKAVQAGNHSLLQGRAEPTSCPG